MAEQVIEPVFFFARLGRVGFIMFNHFALIVVRKLDFLEHQQECVLYSPGIL